MTLSLPALSDPALAGPTSMPHAPAHFMIACAARTGSTMLVRTLRSHPGVVMHGEVWGDAMVGLDGPLARERRRRRWSSTTTNCGQRSMPPAKPSRPEPTDQGATPPSSGKGLIASPFHHCFSGPSTNTAKCRCGAAGSALPVEPT